MDTQLEQHHELPHPHPPHTATGRGGRRPGAGRRATYRQPVRVLVTLEAAELEAITTRWPGLSRSQAIRRAVAAGLSGRPGMVAETEGAGNHGAGNEGAESEVSDALISDTKIKAADNSGAGPSEYGDESPMPAAEGGGEPGAEAEPRTVRLTYGQAKTLRSKVLFWLDGRLEEWDGVFRWFLGLGLPTIPERGEGWGDTFETSVSLEDCRRLRRAINRWLRVWKDRLASERAGYLRQVREEKRKPKRFRRSLVTPDRFDAGQRQRYRALNGELRRALAGIPWQ